MTSLTASHPQMGGGFQKINTMSNTSTIHIKTDFDCKVYDYGQELGTTKADTYFNVELRKGMFWNGAVHCNDCSADVVFVTVELIAKGDYDWQTAVTDGWNRRAGT